MRDQFIPLPTKYQPPSLMHFRTLNNRNVVSIFDPVNRTVKLY